MTVPRPVDPRIPHVRVQRTRQGTFLMVDDSCASLWRPGQETTGGTWDLLAAPVLLLPAAPAPRVLLLGVGGGSVVRVLRALRRDAAIVGVDLDAQVLEVARREFALDALGATIVCGEARRFVAALTPAQRFDLIIDDIYQGSGDGMRKPHGWPATLRRAAARLARGGILVCNALDRRDALAMAAAMPQPWVALAHADYHNRIVVGGRAPALTARAVSRALRAAPLLAATMQRTCVRSAI